MKPLKVALFAETSSYYIDMLFGLARGFESFDIDTYVGIGQLSPQELYTFCRQYKPSIVFELNRSRTDLPDLDPNILHIAWFQDYVGGILERKSLSEITYFWLSPESLGYKYSSSCQSVLLSGADPDAYFYETPDKISDFSFVGFIPLPLNMLLPVNHILASHPVQNCVATFGQVTEQFLKQYQWGAGQLDYKEINEMVFRIIKSLIGTEARDQVSENDLRVFNEQIIRLVERKRMVDIALGISNSIRVFGHKNWSFWPQYAKYYDGFLFKQSDMRQVYQTTWLNLHNNNHGAGMHSRVLDSMASGGCIVVNESPQDQLPGGINTFFDPYVHYLPYTFDTFEDTLREYLPQKDRLKAMAKEASKLILAQHTWQHRAKQILDDLKNF